VDGFVKPAAIEELSKGMWLADPKKGGFKTGRSHIRVVKRGRERSILEITLREGRNRQVRRMTAAVGYPTLRLVRWRVGPWSIEGLAPGQWREVAGVDAATLRNKR
jgi:pseudouridine synthase